LNDEIKTFANKDETIQMRRPIPQSSAPNPACRKGNSVRSHQETVAHQLAFDPAYPRAMLRSFDK
jgi:hypothetical protein